nr:phage tail tape measure protein [Shinella yambaruensis]
MAGGAFASAAVVSGAAIRASMADEFTSDQLMVLGQYSEADQARYDRQLAAIGARKGIGAKGAMGVFGGLMSGGLSAQDASAMTENAIVFAKASQADVGDAAATTIALRNNLGIGAGDMMSAYDAMALGGKEGQFEVPDMARNFPSLAAKMSAVGESGLQGVKGLVAMAQAIRATAGSSDEAATNFENMLDKFTAPDFVKNAADLGINVEQTFKKAKDDGLSPVLALIDQIGKKVGDNPFKLSELLPDRQARAAIQAVLGDLTGVRSQIEKMGKSEGTVLDDYAKASDNASTAFDRFTSNVAAKAKFLAAYALPPLTAAMNEMSEAMEGDREPQQIKAPEDASGETKAAIQAANDRGARLNRFFEGILGFEKSGTSRKLDMVDAYQQYGQSRMEGEQNKPGFWQRFLWGAAADEDFALREHVRATINGRDAEQLPLGAERNVDGSDLGRSTGAVGKPTRRPNNDDLGQSTDLIPLPLARPAELDKAASASMSAYTSALAAEGEEAKSTAQSIADSIKAMLGFTVSPTISPTYIPAGSAGTSNAGSEKHTSVQQSTGVKLTQNISSPNSKHAAMRSVREQNRAIRQAQARSYAETGRNLA